mgnify:CR=1 FL=1
MTLKTLASTVAAGIDPKKFVSVRAPKLEKGKSYIMRLWLSKGHAYQAVEFVGAGQTVDSLLSENPRIKDLKSDILYFFKSMDESGKVSSFSAFGHEPFLAVGVGVEDSDESIPTRVTFLAVPGTEPAKSVKPKKAPKAKTVIKTEEKPAVPLESTDA